MRTRSIRRAAGAILASLLLLAGAGAAGPPNPSAAAPGAGAVAGCPVLPPDNVWNARVDSLPLHSRSADYITSIGATTGLKADFGSGQWQGGPIGIPFVTVPTNQPRVPVRFSYADESDPGPYPIPTNAPIEGGPTSGGDRHVLVLDQGNCVLYELFSAFPRSDGSWDADSGAVFPLTSNRLCPAGWTSADAAGLPILPGLVRYDEIAAGRIDHAVRFTAQVTQRAYLWPARHYASNNTNLNLPPMGIRVRLKAAFDTSSFSPENRVLLQAFKTYGLILADNGSNWFISGAPDERWNNDLLRQLASVKGSDFEVVDVSSLLVDPNSGQARTGGSLPTPTATTIPATPTPSPTATAVPPAEQTLVLQGAALIGDTWVTPDEPGTAHGTWPEAHLQGSYTPDRLLLLPQLTGLPPGANVQRATLAVYAYASTGTVDTLAAHRVLRSWSPATATYRSPWRRAGLKPDVDYVGTPLGTTPIGGVGWLEVDVTSAVRAWTTGTPNRGLLLRLAAGDPVAHYRVYLTEHTDPARRPKLTVTYR